MPASMIRYIFIIASSIAFVSSLTWENCSDTNANHSVTFTKLDVSPEKIVFPGNLSINLTMTFKEKLDEAYLDIEIYKMLFGFPLKIPCLNGTVVGSCSDINACEIFNISLHDNSYGQQAEKIMNQTQNHTMVCPLTKETVKIENAHVELYKIPDVIQFLAGGQYMITARAKTKKDGKGPYDIGCIKLNVTLGGDASSGFLLG